jgi:hypothetical protein
MDSAAELAACTYMIRSLITSTMSTKGATSTISMSRISTKEVCGYIKLEGFVVLELGSRKGVMLTVKE